MDDDFLKWGDQICLYSDTAMGYIATSGFNSPKIYLQMCSQLHPSTVINNRNLVFQIIPKLGYDAMKEFKREMKQAKSQSKPKQDINDAQAMQMKIKMLERRIQQQHLNNDNWILMQHGKKVTYGSQIQLRHVDSGMYLQHAKKSSQFDRQCSQIELSSVPSAQRVTFYIQQRYKYRQDGEAVVFNDHILLYNQKYNCYLHVSEGHIQNQSLLKTQPSKYRPLSPLRRPNPDAVYRKCETNCSSNFYKWQVVNYRQQGTQDPYKYIHSGNIVRLKHAETAGYLCYDENSSKENGYPCYVRIYKGQDDNDKFTTNSLFEIERHEDHKNETIQNDGMVLQWRERGNTLFSQIRLRHVNSGKLLTLKMFEKKPNKKNAKAKPKQQLIITLGDNLSAAQINSKLDRMQEIVNENKKNYDFNVHTNQEILGLSKSIGPDQVFEIENTVVDPETRIKNTSVVKLQNKYFNYVTKAYENLTVSTAIKKLEGDEQMAEGDEEADASMFLAEDSKRGDSEIVNDINASEGGLHLDVNMTKRSEQASLTVQVQNVEEDEEAPELDDTKFTPMMYDESDNIIINNTKLIKGGSMDDVFIIELVSIEEVNSVLFIHSCVPKIKEFVYNMRNFRAKLDSPYMKAFEDLLQGLVKFVIESDNKDPFTSEGVPNQQNQKFLREIRIIDLLVDILIYPFEGPDPLYNLEDLTQKSPMTRVCQLIYRLIKHCVKENDFNKFYAAQWISHFFHQSMMTTIQNDLMAEGTIGEILKNNKQLLDKQINSTVIRNIIEICASSQKNQQFLNLLCSLCSCGDESIGSNQDDICDLLLPENLDEEAEFDTILVKIETRIEGTQRAHYILFDDDVYHNGDQPLAVKIDNLFKFFTEKRDLRLYDYFESQSKMQALMCMDRNYKGINILCETFNLDFALDSFLNAKIPKLLRSNIARCLLYMHIDKDPLEPINLPILTRVWQEISSAKITLPKPKGMINVKLFKLKDFLIEYFTNMGGIMRSWDTEVNTLTLEVLSIFENMVNLGFYQSDEELIQILNPVIDLLDGSNDYTSPQEEEEFHHYLKKTKEYEEIKAAGGKLPDYPELKKDKEQRYKDCDQNLQCFAIKKKIIKILHYVMDIQNDIRLTKFLAEYAKSDSKLMLSPGTAGPELFYLQNVLDRNVCEEDEVIANQCNKKIIDWMKVAYLDKTLDMRVKSEKDLICILLDIILYQDSVMVNSAFTLLARYFQQKRSIIQYSNEVQLMQDEQDVAILKKVSHDLRDLKLDAENSEFWIGTGEEDKGSLKKARNFINQLEMLTELCTFIEGRVFDFDDKKKKNEDEADEEEEKDDLNEFLNLTELLQEWDNEDPKVCDDDEINDVKNQTLLKNLRAYEVPLIIIKQQGLDGAENPNSYLRVLEKCYIFLIKFVRNNSDNQHILVEYIDIFMDDIEYGVHAWELICEIFRNSDMLMTYNLVPIIKKAIKLIDILPVQTQKKTILLSFLTYFCTMKGQEIRPNQIVVCTEITSSQRKNSDYLYVGETGLRELHMDMLEMKHSYAEFMKQERFLQEIQIPPEVCYTMEYVRLLGRCGQGKNSVTESIASDKMSLFDLIENMKMADFCYPLKSSLVYFMDSIYFEVEKDVSDENIQMMWEVINIIYQDMEKFLQIEQRVKSQKAGTAPPKRVIAMDDGDEEDLDGIEVDINKNFNMLTAFGSQPIVLLMEKYIFDIVFPAIMHYLELKIPIKPDQKDFFLKFFSILQKIVSFCNKDQHFERAKQLFKSVKQYPQYKEFGGESLQNKQLTQYMQSKETQGGSRDPEDMMVGMPNLNQAQKLQGYQLSVGPSEELLFEFEKEFEDIVVYIINVDKKTEFAFDGLNTLSVKELIQSLIQVSDIGSDIDPNLRIICLKVIRKVIEMENKQETGTASVYWDDFSMFEDDIKNAQDTLLELGVVDLLCNLIAYETKRTIQEQALLVAIACLLGGNMDAQNRFSIYIKSDATNKFAMSLRELLFTAIESVNKTQQTRNELKMKMIQLHAKIEELESFTKTTKAIRIELHKTKEQKKLVQEDIEASNADTSENPAAYTTNTLTVHRAITNCYVIIKFMQFLCEGHNIICQDALRQQCNEDGKAKLNSYDFTQFLAKTLEQFQNTLNDQTFDVCNQLVDTLTEAIQGPCKLNQKSLVNAKIIDSSREYITCFEKDSELAPLGFDDEYAQDNIGEFKQKIITMLTSLLEGEVDYDIINKMANSLDFNMMKNRLLKVFTRFAMKMLDTEIIVIKDLPLSKLNNRLDKDSFEGSIQEAFEIYILMHSLADNVEVAHEQLKRQKFNQDQWKAYEFIKSHTGRIEINVNGSLQRIYFPIQPVCLALSKAARVGLMQRVNRESQSAKVKDLLDAIPDLKDEMVHNEELSRATIQITPTRLMALKDFSTVVGLIMNFLYLCFAKRMYHYRALDIPIWVIDTIEILGFIQGSSSFVLIFFFAINKKNLITKAKWREFLIQQAECEELQIIANDDRLDVQDMSYEMTHQILMIKGPDATEFNLDEAGPNYGNWFTWSELYIMNMYFFIQDPTFQYYVLYFGISLLGKYSSDIYYSLHLLDVINRSQVLQNVVLAVTSNLTQVSLTGILMMILVYIYTSMTFFYIQDGMYDYGVNAYDSDIVGENNCLTMFQCFVTELDKGMRNGGGVGDITEPIHFNDETEKYLIKLCHDATFQIIINIICLNIIFGIIVNTFAEMRDQKSFNDNDMLNRCYICNLEKMIFDKNVDGGFVKHIDDDHNLWFYVYYLVHLELKDSSDYSGVESYVSDKQEIEDISWVPSHKAISLQDIVDDEGDDKEAEELNEMMKDWRIRILWCIDSIAQVQKKINKKEKQVEEEKKEAEKRRKDDELSQIIS